ncbi:fasciclin domain-containing protein [Plectonema radiosum NIES-515]|uniref:Fasciclin domain-containing protein n=1 Tax=Plectonema radiosum NIES-515 TaxID=2986073 RepID=A0ABT3B7Z6_9CYAN|nr:fasciclin domain-containing protein [Plectonema radiosum]MCV3217501.1 fasciclin domain-containing protein [Plectonema radiosum NIES-515]
MKVNYNRKLLTKLAGLVGATGASFLMIFSARANEVLNPNPGVFSEAPYNRGQRVLVNAEYTPTEPELAKKGKKPAPRKSTVSQSNQTGSINPKPSIFNEAPYNRSGRTAPGETPSPPTTPDATPTPTPTPGSTETPPTPGSTETPPTPGSTETPSPTKPSGGSSNTSGKNLVALAEADGSFKTLTKALKAAGLTQILQGKENYTIFAPTDAAFAKLKEGVLDDLLKSENKEVLVKVLTYHLVKGQVLSTDLKSGEVKSVEGGAINVKVDPTTGVTVNEAKVTKADIKGSNGVIHAIDQLIIPPDL